jgi:hypothetical protein
MQTHTDTDKPAGQPGEKIETQLRDLALDVLADNDGEFEVSLEAFQGELLSRDVAFLRACMGDQLFVKVTTDYLRLARASAHGRVLGQGAMQRVKGEVSQDARRRRLGREINGMLLSYQVAGKPLGVCTKAELVASAASDIVHSKFKTAVAKVLPTDEAIVAHHLTAQAAKKIWSGVQG